VEEQFYFFWPCLILFLPAKHLLKVIIGAILIAPIFQMTGQLAGLKPITVNVMVIGCLGFLGTGALLAYFKFHHPQRFVELGRRKIYLVSGIVLFALMASVDLRVPHGLLSIACLSMITCLFFGWLVHQAAIGFPGVVGALLKTPPLLYCGRISYGIYVYHMFMPWLVRRGFSKLHIPPPESPVLLFLLYTGATILVATCSWYLFENPINNLKRHFEYRKA
jgi:peptidoglycan/LPS O-acetylase OafA/YrhL